MIDGLAFLPVNDVHTCMTSLRRVASAAALPLLNYFDDTYVAGSTRTGPRQVRIVPPRFPPSMWNVHQATIDDEERTNNYMQAFNRRAEELVGHQHPSVWSATEAFQADAAEASAAILRQSVGNLVSTKKRRQVRQSQEALQ